MGKPPTQHFALNLLGRILYSLSYDTRAFVTAAGESILYIINVFPRFRSFVLVPSAPPKPRTLMDGEVPRGLIDTTAGQNSGPDIALLRVLGINRDSSRQYRMTNIEFQS